MINYDLPLTVDLGDGFRSIRGLFPNVLALPGNKNAHAWIFRIKRNGQAEDLTGASILGRFENANGITIPILGTISGNTCTVTMDQSCYAVPGKLRCVFTLTTPSVGPVPLADIMVSVSQPLGSDVSDPLEIIPDMAELLVMAETLDMATEEVNAAIANASDAAALANEKAGLAVAAAGSIPGLVDTGIQNERNWRKAMGNPARFFPVPASALAVKALLTAYQAGSGDPSPTNIRAIFPAVEAGGTVKAMRTGKSVLKLKALTTLTSNGVTYTPRSDGGITVSGTASGGQSSYDLCGVWGGNQIQFWLKAGVNYVFTRIPGCSLVLYGKQGGVGSIVALPYGGSGILNISQDFAVTFAYFSVPNGTTVNGVVYPQLEIAEVNTSYEPYAGDEYTLTAQQAKYGLPGAEDTIGNDGSEAHKTALLTLNGTENWQKWDVDKDIFTLGISAGIRGAEVSSHLGRWNGTAWGSFPNDTFYIDAAVVNIRHNGVGSISGFKSWLAAQLAAGTPVQVLYQLATPTTASGAAVSTPALPALDKYAERMNVVTVDKGSAEVGFAEHPNRDFARLTEKTGYGVVSGLGVTAQSTPNMTINVAPGIIYLPSGDRYALLGAAGLAVNAAHATNPRIDIVYVSTAGVITYLAGTAAATPSAPALPAGGILLAEIAVAAGVTSITAANIADRRKNIFSEVPIIPTLLNAWEHYDSARGIRFWKDADGMVNVDGMGKTGAANVVAWQFPAGYRPKAGRTHRFFIANGVATSGVRCTVSSVGEVMVEAAYTSYVDFSGIRFKGEA